MTEKEQPVKFSKLPLRQPTPEEQEVLRQWKVEQGPDVEIVALRSRAAMERQFVVLANPNVEGKKPDYFCSLCASGGPYLVTTTQGVTEAVYSWPHCAFPTGKEFNSNNFQCQTMLLLRWLVENLPRFGLPSYRSPNWIHRDNSLLRTRGRLGSYAVGGYAVMTWREEGGAIEEALFVRGETSHSLMQQEAYGIIYEARNNILRHGKNLVSSDVGPLTSMFQAPFPEEYFSLSDDYGVPTTLLVSQGRVEVLRDSAGGRRKVRVQIKNKENET